MPRATARQSNYLMPWGGFCPCKWHQGRSRVKGSIFRVRRVELSAVLMDGPQQDKERKPGKNATSVAYPLGGGGTRPK